MATQISGDTGVSQVQDGVVQTEDIAAEAVSFSKLLQSEWGKSLAASGYQKLPSGLIIQWVSGAFTSGTTYSLPIAFPNAFLAAGATHFSDAAASAAATAVRRVSLSQFIPYSSVTTLSIIAIGY